MHDLVNSLNTRPSTKTTFRHFRCYLASDILANFHWGSGSKFSATSNTVIHAKKDSFIQAILSLSGFWPSANAAGSLALAHLYVVSPLTFIWRTHFAWFHRIPADSVWHIKIYWNSYEKPTPNGHPRTLTLTQNKVASCLIRFCRTEDVLLVEWSSHCIAISQLKREHTAINMKIRHEWHGISRTQKSRIDDEI